MERRVKLAASGVKSTHRPTAPGDLLLVHLCERSPALTHPPMQIASIPRHLGHTTKLEVVTCSLDVCYTSNTDKPFLRASLRLDIASVLAVAGRSTLMRTVRLQRQRCNEVDGWAHRDGEMLRLDEQRRDDTWVWVVEMTSMPYAHHHATRKRSQIWDLDGFAIALPVAGPME